MGAFRWSPPVPVIQVVARWQMSILGISWKDKVTNKEMRVRTGQHSMDDILSERRLRWLGHASPAHTSTGVALGGSGV